MQSQCSATCMCTQAEQQQQAKVSSQNIGRLRTRIKLRCSVLVQPPSEFQKAVRFSKAALRDSTLYTRESKVELDNTGLPQVFPEIECAFTFHCYLFRAEIYGIFLAV